MTAGAIVLCGISYPVAVVGIAVAGVVGVAAVGVGVYYLTRDKYGDIMKVETSGASRQTAQFNYRNGKAREGVRASHQMAEEDVESVAKYKKIIKKVAKEHNIDPALIAAIMSRESRAGKDLDEGWGDHRRAWGLMQIDIRWHKIKEEDGWDTEKHLSQATGILVGLIKDIQKKKAFSDLSKEKQLKGGIAAYNMGDKNVHSYSRVDENTTGGDYSNDVVARAQWYKRNEKRWLKD